MLRERTLNWALTALFTGSVDKSIQAVNVETGEVFYKVPKAHG